MKKNSKITPRNTAKTSNPAKTSSVNIAHGEAFLSGALYSGPLPHPKILEAYEHLLSGATDRVFTLAEKNQEYDREQMQKHYGYFSLGQWFAFIGMLVSLGVIVYLADHEHDWVAGILAGTTIGTIIAAFSSSFFRHKNLTK